MLSTRLERVDLYHVRVPLVRPWRTAYGSDAAVGAVMARLVTDRGHGWGESTPLAEPTYSPEYAAGVFRVVRDFMAPALRGRTIASGQAITDALRPFKGNPFAKAAIDLAWWDAQARAQDKPLWQLFGGTGPTAEGGTGFGVADSIDDLVADIDRALERGYQRVKLKFSRDWGIDVVAAVRRRHPDLTLHIDCNSSFTLDDAEMFRALDDLNLAMIEQPLGHDDLVDHAKLQRMIRTPICLDESISSPGRARKAIEIGACGWINIKPGRVGGFTAALDIHAQCVRANLPVWIGSMIESALGNAGLAALATLPGVKYPCDLLNSPDWFTRDPVTTPLPAEGPTFFLSDAPGLGVEPDEQVLDELCVERATIDLR